MGIDTDPALLARLDVEVRDGVRFDEVVGLLGKARFAPVFHRPLFRHLGFVTNRTFETFYADTLPVLMLPRDFVKADLRRGGTGAGAGRRRGRAPDGRHAPARGRIGMRCSRPGPTWRAITRMRGASRNWPRSPHRAAAAGSSAVKILFVMKHRGNAGNTHAVANYMRVAPKYGHSVAIYGTPIWYVPELQFSMDISSFDRVVYVFESELYRIKRMQEAVMLAKFPRQHRLILDTDGMYNPVVVIDGYDFNHRDEAERAQWIEHLDALSDRVMQTTRRAPDQSAGRRLDVLRLQPGAPGRSRRGAAEAVRHPACRPQLVAMAGGVRRAAAGLRADSRPGRRDRVHRPVVGRAAAEGPAAGPEQAFESDPEAFRRLRIQTPKAVMYHDVIQTMSTARINIFTQRPLLRHLKHLTLKYFEIFCADTIPLLMLDADHAEAVYGPAARDLVLSGRIAEKLLDALRRPQHYRGDRRRRPPPSDRALFLRPAGRGTGRGRPQLAPCNGSAR